MSVADMERRLLALSEEYQRTRDPQIREQYRALHAEYVKAKA